MYFTGISDIAPAAGCRQAGGRQLPSLWTQSIPTSVTEMVNKTHTLKNTWVLAERNSHEPIYMLASGWDDSLQFNRINPTLFTWKLALIPLQYPVSWWLIPRTLEPPQPEHHCLTGKEHLTHHKHLPLCLTATQNLSLTKWSHL